MKDYLTTSIVFKLERYKQLKEMADRSSRSFSNMVNFLIDRALSDDKFIISKKTKEIKKNPVKTPKHPDDAGWDSIRQQKRSKPLRRIKKT